MKALIAILVVTFWSFNAFGLESKCHLYVFYELEQGSILADQIPIDKIIKKKNGVFRSATWKLPPNMRREDLPPDMINELTIHFTSMYSSALAVIGLTMPSNKEKPNLREDSVFSTIQGETVRVHGDGMSFQVVCRITEI